MEPTLVQVFAYLNAKQFFTAIVPGIPSWFYKLKGKNGRGEAMKFTAEEIFKIRAGLDQLAEKLMACTGK